jgi:energy-coupling factor transport system substrate-specific component
MCGIAITSRAIFIWLPHFKPMTAIIIITGIAFGTESGFLAGTISEFVSNFIFGQGPWTQWQMFALGIADF